MVAYVLGFVALSVICNGVLMGMVRRAPIVASPPRPHMMPEETELAQCG